MEADCPDIDALIHLDTLEFQMILHHEAADACLEETRWTEVSWQSDNPLSNWLDNFDAATVKTDVHYKMMILRCLVASVKVLLVHHQDSTQLMMPTLYFRVHLPVSHSPYSHIIALIELMPAMDLAVGAAGDEHQSIVLLSVVVVLIMRPY